MQQQARSERPAAEVAPDEVKHDSSRADKLKDEIDGLLDEIDSVLEENAAQFVADYVQKAGE